MAAPQTMISPLALIGYKSVFIQLANKFNLATVLMKMIYDYNTEYPNVFKLTIGIGSIPASFSFCQKHKIMFLSDSCNMCAIEGGACTSCDQSVSDITTCKQVCSDYCAICRMCVVDINLHTLCELCNACKHNEFHRYCDHCDDCIDDPDHRFCDHCNDCVDDPDHRFCDQCNNCVDDSEHHFCEE